MAQDLDLDFAPMPVRALAARGLWLEQQCIVLDPRIPDALEAALIPGILDQFGSGEPKRR